MLTRHQKRSIFVLLLALIVETVPLAIGGLESRAWVVCLLFVAAAVLWAMDGLG